jgi:predicted dehydrogenase
MSNMPKKKIRIAVVGCGAIVEQQHLPSLVRRDDCQVTTLVERNLAQAERLAEKFEIPQVFPDYHDLLDSDVDAVVIGLPNHLHAPVSIELLKAGLHLLVEKPMALSVAECDAMLAAAEAGQAILAVGLMRRFSHAGRFAKWAIESDLLGQIVSFDIQNGFVYQWPITTDYLLHKDMAGGGVLIDLGVHTLDQLLWWLGDVESFLYYDDNYGGVEADCKLYLTLKSGVEGTVELSRTRNLRETAIIRGERAELEVSLVSSSVSLRFLNGGVGMSGHAILAGEPILPDQRVADLIAAEHQDFLQAVRTGRPAIVSGAEGRRSIAFAEACYAKRRPLKLPWVELQPTSPSMEKSQ